jgi:outer membrane receptor protein involved in Fe transport
MTHSNFASPARPECRAVLRGHCFGTASALAIISGLAPPVLAQTTPPAQAAQAPSIEEIVVTGSRIVRNGYEAPTPVSIVSAEQMQQSGVTQLADFVNQLPSLSGSTTRNDVTVSSGLQGLALLNLRALGTTRTLVLLDGQRSVASAVTGEVDTANMPADLVSRVDVVTGGASSAYGSDAIAGVVNFVLDKTYTGLKGEVSGGVSTFGDDRNWKVSLTGGTGFGNDRGHFLLSGSVAHNDGVLLNYRAWNQLGNKIMLNPAYSATNGQPEYLWVTGAGIDQGLPGGIINSGPLKGVYFGPSGTPAMLNYGSLVKDPYMVGGDWKATVQDTFQSLDTLLSQKSAFTRLSYDVTDAINVFAQLSWNETFAFHNDANHYQLLAVTVLSGNPFIPAPVQAQMNALKLSNLRLGTFLNDLGPFATDNTRYTNRYVIGGNGKFDASDSGWTWDAYFQSGETRAAEAIYNNAVKPYVENATDAVRNPTTGAIVCRSTLASPNNGCVPLNLFGTGVNSQAALSYITNGYNGPHRNERFVQDVGAANVRGEPFSDWAGAVSLAFGIEHRWEAVHDGPSDPLDAAGAYYNGNFQPNIGSYSVTEGYIETVVPLAKNQAWAQNLDLNGAVRGTGYSVSGYVTTWKIGATWTPISSITFRGTRSRDIRAPNLNELFAAGTSGPNALVDPFSNNATVAYNGITGGNTNLKPEVANSLGIGAVLQPTFFPGFNASVDYYDIHMDNAIGSASGQQIDDLCFQGHSQFCSQIVRTLVQGQPYITVYLVPQNFVNLVARGIDFEASYATRLSDIVDSWDGNVSMRFLATHFISNFSNSGIPGLIPTDTAGENSGSGPPHWRYQGTLLYVNDPVSVQIAARGVSAGTYSNSWIECTSGCPTSTSNNRTINYNRIEGALYWDATFTYKFHVGGDNDQEEAYLSVRNIANADPVAVHQGPTSDSYKSNAANCRLYDCFGRVFRAGLRFKM